MDDQNSGLDERQAAAALALAEGQKISVVAIKAGVTDRTIRRWKEIPAFAALVAQTQADTLESARIRLSGLVDDALDAVTDVLRDKAAPAAARLRAAEVILQRVGLDAEQTSPAADPADVNRILTYLRWDEEQQRKGRADALQEGGDDAR